MRTCPPGVSWYLSLSAHETRSGQRVGTVAATRPPGRSTRTISTIARSSSQMCSSTSDTTMRSNVLSSKGSCSASPLTAPAHCVDSDLVAREHRAGDRSRVLEVGRGVVEGGDARTAPHPFEQMTTTTGPEVEQAFAAREPQSVEVDGQQFSGPRRRTAGAACASSSR